MNKSQILYKAATEHLIIDNIFERPIKQWYLCLAVQVASPFDEQNQEIRNTIEEDVIANGYISGFGYGNRLGDNRNQMQVAMYGLFLSEYFKDIE